MKMRQITKRMLCFCLCILLFSSLLPLFASAETSSDATIPSMAEARAVWFSHMESDRLVASKDATLNVGAGSSVKVMSGLLFCELLKDDLYDELHITNELLASIKKYSTGHELGFKVGDVFYVYDVLSAAICGSFNDAFYALAIRIDGSVDAFLERMNARAATIGMTDTEFRDVTGIISGSRTTAADMAKLAKVAYANTLYMEICNQVSYTCLKDPTVAFNNRNALICQYDETKYYEKYCQGMSAGTTTADGNCVITVAKHKEETYICVVLGGTETDTDLYGYRIANRLINWVYKTYSYVPVITPDMDICTVPVTVSDMTTAVKVRTNESLYAYLPANAKLGTDVTYSIRLINTELEAPFEENTFVGYVAVIYEGRVLGTLSLYTVESAERSGIIGSLKSLQAWLQNRAVIAGILFFVIALAAWIITEYILWRRRHHKWDKYFSDKMEMPEQILKQKKPDPNRLRKR